MPVICWFRRVLRLDDHPALVAAAAEGGVIPLIILDPAEAQAYPASAERQALSLPPLKAALERHGSRLIVRRGAPAEVLAAIARETGASAIHTTEGFPFAADDGLAEAAARAGAQLHLHPLADLVPRGHVLTQTGGPFKVFSPFWKALRRVEIAPPLDAPKLSAPDSWPQSETADWPEARAAMRRGWDVLAARIEPGEEAALARLDRFLGEAVTAYANDRNLPGKPGTSTLSEALAVGEISARRFWHRCQPALHEGRPGVETFLSELAWREFARELMHNFPQMDQRCWREDWEGFPWRGESADADAWRRAETGIDMVDAGMRELYATGRMHNRVRMITASYLCKHLLTHWKIGLDWFAECLVDWDAASNAMNWQWVAGCGPDASPYFRVFNPDGQAEKFDADARYRRYWLDPEAEGAQAFAAAAPLSWRVDLTARRQPSISLAEGRARALEAYQRVRQ